MIGPYAPGATFEVRFTGFPAGGVGTFRWHLDDNAGTVTAPSVAGITESAEAPGQYVVLGVAPSPPGQWAVVFDMGEPVFPWTSASVDLLVVEAGAPAPVGGGPNFGPCVPWVTGDDLNCGGDPTEEERNQVALEASQALFEISGRQFTGLCSVKVRPCSDLCSCFGTTGGAPHAWLWMSAELAGNWVDECGDRCGCTALSRVKLPGYPVREITSVKIGGELVAPSEYAIDRHRWLIRRDDPGPPVSRRSWPGCQNLTLDDSEPGTFSVRYLFGMDPPELGRSAAKELACQLYAACSGGTCTLPQGTTRVTRQGVTVERSMLDPSKPMGLPALDLFLRTYWQSKARRRSAVWSPDTPSYARREMT